MSLPFLGGKMGKEHLSDSIEQDTNQINSATRDGMLAASGATRLARNSGLGNRSGRSGINSEGTNLNTGVNPAGGMVSGNPVTENAKKNLNDFMFSSGKKAVRAKVTTAAGAMLKSGLGIIAVLALLFVLVLIPLVATTLTSVTAIMSGASYSGSSAIVAVALEEEGTVGGDKYRKWYIGKADGEAWCATFVSWCANECGYIEEGIIPKFQGCQAGMNWFKDRNQYIEASSGYIPKIGDIIFYNWDSEPDPDHVGIVQYVENNIVVTIEGNTDGNKVKTRSRGINKNSIMGYGIPAYPDDVEYVALEGNSNAEIVWNFFRAHGYSEAATAGILGNLKQESGINPKKNQDGGGPGRGISQWELGSDRFTNLKKWASKEGKEWTELEVQLNFMLHELNGAERTFKDQMNKHYGGIENLKKTSDVEWAAKVMSKAYHRPGKPRLDLRIKYAKQYYNKFAH